MSNKISDFLAILIIIAVLFFIVSGITWQFRNPTANQITVFTHLPQVLTFQKLEKFQGNHL